MAAIAGVLSADGGASAATERMLTALAHRGRAMLIHDEGHVAIGLASAAIPAVRPPGGPPSLFVVLDGRLDNREEIAHQIGCPRAIDDAHLIALAYEKWDDAFVERLLGDFAFAIWDSVNRRLLCARDALGVKPFYYAEAPRGFVFASELQVLFAGADLSRAPNEGFLAELLADDVVSRDETPFRGIRRLPPAHLISVEGTAIAVRRYWTPRPPPAARPASEDEHAEAFLDLLREAVRCRMAGRDDVGVLLSGGLDSSSIVALASEVRGQAGGAPVHAYSLVFPGRSCDESAFIDHVVRDGAIQATRVTAARCNGELLFDDAWRYLGCGDAPNGGPMLAPLLAAAQADGCGVVLTGDGGDEWLTGSFFRYADLLSAGRIGQFVRDVRRAPRLASALRRAAVFGVWPLVPRLVQYPVRAAWRRTGGRRLPPWIDPRFARRTSLDQRCRRPPCEPRSGWSRATWDVAQYLTDGAQSHAFEGADRSSQRWGIEERHPFYDRRVVEYSLALPDAERAEGAETKRVLRRAMRGLVPDAVRLRRGKAEFSSVVFDGLEYLGGERRCGRLAIAREGWIDPRALTAAYRRTADLVARRAVAPALPALWRAFAVDLWFRAVVLREPRPAAAEWGVAP